MARTTTLRIPIAEITRSVLTQLADRLGALAVDDDARRVWLAAHHLDEYSGPMEVLEAVAASLREATVTPIPKEDDRG